MNLTKLKTLIKQASHQTIICIVGFLFISITWGAVALLIERDYQTTVESIHRENNNLAKAFEEHIRRTLIGLGNKLEDIAEVYEREGIVTPTLRSILTSKGNDPAIIQLSIIDSNGDFVASRVPPSLNASNLADREYFQALRETNMRGIHIAKPLIGRSTGKWSIYVSHRMNNPDGSFKGIITTGLLIDYFGQFYKTMELGDGKYVVLIGKDGIIRVRVEDEDVTSGQDVRTSELYKQAQLQASGSLLITSVADWKQRFVSYRVMPDYPLYVVVGTLKEQALASHYQRRFAYNMSAVFVSLIILGAGYLIVRHRKQELRLQNELVLSEEMLSKVFHASPDAISISRLQDGLYYHVNESFCRIFGFARNEILGRTIHALNLWVNPQERAEMLALLQDRGQVEGFVVQLRCKDDIEKLFETYWRTIEIDGIRCLVAILSDITDRKLAENELQKYRHFFHFNRDIMLFVDGDDGRIMDCNPVAEAIYGYSREELLNMYIFDFRATDLQQEVKDQMLQALATGITFESMHRRRDGGLIPVEVNSIGQMIDNRKVLFSVIRDIRDRKRTEAENLSNLQRMNQMERLSSLGTLAAGVAHEVNQPLQALKVTADGMCYWLERGKSLDPEQAKENCGRISRSAERISTIVKRLRDFVNRSRSADMAAVNLNDVEKGVLELLQQRLKSHNISLQEKLSAETPLVWGNSTRLEEIFINFLVNAMQALDSIDRSDKEIVITTECKDDIVVLDVFNNGPPIPQGIINKIFDPFFSTKTDNSENMGLGLSIVHSIVSEHGGHIAAKNHDGGVSFQVEFPMYKE